ncbi:aldo/keto reductase [Actinobacillus succinogenes]|uniref:Aldo/keto reductase n=1 Tax=Actinobacillus succinogenes (strain ATCC 55618 / DSM 22257 / CCUG 43843 / 130Z) TaxID=339671 RepID=A6VQF7_ACTSZ|nr:aldo/keto reductase [Actinobacillus succinogenes]ABR75204.1 aldo/keto reductase [Actinobacillus succinogenes 130Z]PHI40402.1 aldo/keto reductase [Actinobacillus succinogenes]
MKKITLKNGDKLTALGMGTWFMGDNQRYRQEEIAALRYGIEHGINLIDTAEMYGNGRAERLVGEAISPYTRESVYLLSKVLPNNANKRNMERACDNSLKALNTDYLDMYLYHWRGVTPLAETVEELEKLKAKGKIKAWGVSNFDLEDMQELSELPAGKHCQVNEVLFHLGSRGIEYVLKPYQDKHSIPTVAYCPLAQAGALQRSLIDNSVVNTVAKELDCTPYQVLLAFVLAQPNMIAIPKAGQVQHMKENLACLEMKLSPEQLSRLNNAFPGPTRRQHLDIV